MFRKHFLIISLFIIFGYKLEQIPAKWIQKINENFRNKRQTENKDSSISKLTDSSSILDIWKGPLDYLNDQSYTMKRSPGYQNYKISNDIRKDRYPFEKDYFEDPLLDSKIFPQVFKKDIDRYKRGEERDIKLEDEFIGEGVVKKVKGAWDSILHHNQTKNTASVKNSTSTMPSTGAPKTKTAATPINIKNKNASLSLTPLVNETSSYVESSLTDDVSDTGLIPSRCTNSSCTQYGFFYIPAVQESIRKFRQAKADKRLNRNNPSSRDSTSPSAGQYKKITNSDVEFVKDLIFCLKHNQTHLISSDRETTPTTDTEKKTETEKPNSESSDSKDEKITIDKISKDNEQNQTTKDSSDKSTDKDCELSHVEKGSGEKTISKIVESNNDHKKDQNEKKMHQSAESVFESKIVCNVPAKIDKGSDNTTIDTGNMLTEKLKFLAHLHHPVYDVGRKREPVDLVKLQQMIDKAKYGTFMMNEDEEKSSDNETNNDVPTDAPGVMTTTISSVQNSSEAGDAIHVIMDQLPVPNQWNMPFDKSIKKRSDNRSPFENMALTDDFLHFDDTSNVQPVKSKRKKKKKKKKRKKKFGKSIKEQKVRSGGFGGNKLGYNDEYTYSLKDNGEEGASNRPEGKMGEKATGQSNEYEFNELNDLSGHIDPQQQEDLNRFIKNINSPPQPFIFDLDSFMVTQSSLDIAQFPLVTERAFYQFVNVPLLDGHMQSSITADNKDDQVSSLHSNIRREANTNVKEIKKTNKRDVITQRLKNVYNKVRLFKPLSIQLPFETHETSQPERRDDKASRRRDPSLDAYANDLDTLNFRRFSNAEDLDYPSFADVNNVYPKDININMKDIDIDLDLERKFRAFRLLQSYPGFPTTFNFSENDRF